MLRGKNILVTGVSKGLGLGIAKDIIGRGGVVYGVSRTMTDSLRELTDSHPGTLHWLPYDLSDCQDIQRVIFKEFIGHGTAIHGFVNNAAVAYDDIITNLDLAKLENMFRVNVFSPMNMTKYAIRHMRLHNVRGSIVHLSSISVHTGYKGLAMYASTKGSLEAFSKNTAREWGEMGIRSNALVAGFMETDMSATLSSDQKNRIYKRTSLKIPTTVESVASAISFLLSDGAASITGQNIHVDSGTI